ncbi:RNA-guided endonuclease TnpB family protein [Crassaminicella indica]|uniref:RNA-guided endonuclease TnpB family protein n=1 Tax=Crassaminicella indica TaxID=2855394 RepID=UPI0021076559|nr:RNA-guided endonuclease TnpB family protein [Crassaminicella indica]
MKVAKLHEKVTNQRLDFIHKLSKRIISENQVVVLEDLAVKNMMKNDKLAQSISDVSWYKFVTILVYKAKWYGRKLHKIDRWYPSSKTCSECGYVMEDMPLQIREWKCPKCDSIHDRDINASKNILKQGLVDIA